MRSGTLGVPLEPVSQVPISKHSANVQPVSINNWQADIITSIFYLGNIRHGKELVKNIVANEFICN